MAGLKNMLEFKIKMLLKKASTNTSNTRRTKVQSITLHAIGHTST